MIDQHAAHERLNYEALKAELEETGIASQMMLETIDVKLAPSEIAVFEANKELFRKLGFESNLNGDTVEISAVPGDISWSDTEPLFLELLSQMDDMKQELISDKKQRLIYTISCKASIKANMKIGELEMQRLVEKVFSLNNINTCPHGRPIVISMSKKEIEKDFKRIV
jgi:DNA mismatch repair protein MutL